MSSERVNELASERGMRELRPTERAYLAMRRVLHIIGIHQRVRVYQFWEEGDRLVDMGVMCRVCGR